MFICSQSDLKILDVNEYALELMGISRHILLEKNIHDLIERADPEEIENLHKSGVSFDSYSKVWKLSNSKGVMHYVQFSTHLMRYKGKPAKFIHVHLLGEYFDDVTAQQSIQSLPLSVSNYPLAEIEWDSDLNILRWSEKAEEMFGWTEEEAKASEQLLKEFIHPDDREMVSQALDEAMEKRTLHISMINRNKTKSGHYIYCEWYNSVLYDDDGNVVSIYSLGEDVTGRERAMEHAKRSMNSYQDLFNSISDAIYIINEKGEIVESNVGTTEIYGYEKRELIHENFKKLTAPGKFDEQRISKITAEAASGYTKKYSGWGKRKNGEVFPTEFSVTEGNYFGEHVFIVIERDISDRRAAEEDLRKREELFSKLFTTSPIGITLLNEHHEVNMINDGFRQMFGYDQEELKGLELDKVIVPEGLKSEAVDLSSSNKVKEITTKRKTKAGELLDVIIYAVPVTVGSEVVGIYGIYVDITERERAEEQIKKSLKEKEILLAEIHHRVKNNLAIVTGLLELQSYSLENEDAITALRDSQRRIYSIALVHEKLYNREDFSEVHMDEYISELADEIYKTLNPGILEVNIRKELEDIALPLTKAIPCGLLVNEVLTNSFKHAFNENEEGILSIKFHKTESGKNCLIIRDNGPGFPEKEDKNFTNSLGMTLIETLSKQLEGDVEIKNDGGAVVMVQF